MKQEFERAMNEARDALRKSLKTFVGQDRRLQGLCGNIQQLKLLL